MSRSLCRRPSAPTRPQQFELFDLPVPPALSDGTADCARCRHLTHSERTSALIRSISPAVSMQAGHRATTLPALSMAARYAATGASVPHCTRLPPSPRPSVKGLSGAYVLAGALPRASPQAGFSTALRP